MPCHKDRLHISKVFQGLMQRPRCGLLLRAGSKPMALDEFDLKHKERVGMRGLAVATEYMSNLKTRTYPCANYRNDLRILSAVG